MEIQDTLSDVEVIDKKSPVAVALQQAIESSRPRRQPYAEYRSFIQHHYDGLAGKLITLSGVFTLHSILAGQVLKPSAFDLRGCKRILDAGCGSGRHCKYILRRADSDASLYAFDLSQRMLKRARRRSKTDRIRFLAADLTRLPYPDAAFDAIICGWVLEHLPDPRPGLMELARILQPGGKLLLMTTEDTFAGAMSSNLWHCRTYNRRELRKYCEECGLAWQRPLYFTDVHRFLKLGGIIVELRRAAIAS